MEFLRINRERFRLEVWQGKGSSFIRVHRFKIGVGRLGQATPSAPYLVIAKSREPTWEVPNSEWAIERGLKPGRRYPFKHRKNPFAGGFISLAGPPGKKYQGIGIHGTKFDPEVGIRSSAGCVRMQTPDFLKIYDDIIVGTFVDIY